MGAGTDHELLSACDAWAVGAGAAGAAAACSGNHRDPYRAIWSWVLFVGVMCAMCVYVCACLGMGAYMHVCACVCAHVDIL